MLMLRFFEDGKPRRTRPFGLVRLHSVELPGIELDTEMRMTCGDMETEYAKQRESTRNDLRRRTRC